MSDPSTVVPLERHGIWLASVLRGDAEGLRRVPLESASLQDAADVHGVVCLADRAVQAFGERAAIPSELCELLRIRTREEQGIELARRAELSRTCRAFADARLPALLLKGGALAYTHYPAAHLRPRVDTDLLVREAERDRAIDVLESLGYTRRTAVDRDAIFTQAMFCKQGVGRVQHLVDLHWRVSTRPLFRELLSFDELEPEAVDIPAIGPGARTPGAVHSLLLACVHPAAHHHSEWSLIWLYDVLLLARSLAVDEWARFKTIAADKRVSLICKRTLEATATCFGSERWVLDSDLIAWSRPETADEPSAEYLSQEISPRRDLWLDLAGSKGLLTKCRLLLSHAFPDVRYMREAHGVTGWTGIAAAYGRRLAGAGVQLWRGAATGS